MIPATKQQIILTLLPRTKGVFTRFGLKVNKMRYKNENYMEQYLSGGEVTVAYNPNNISNIWLIENGNYIKFYLIEQRYTDKQLIEMELIENERKKIINEALDEDEQFKIDFARSLQTITSNINKPQKINTKHTVSTKNKSKKECHINYMEEIFND